jgi:two-component system, NarL family, response regulator DesR
MASDPGDDRATPIRVLIVDDWPDHSELCAILMQREPDLEVAGRLDRADELVATCKKVAPHVVLLDVRMPGMPPLEALRQLTKEEPACRVIVCSGLDDPRTIDEAFAAGAWGFVAKHKEFPALLDAVRRVAAGEVVP